MLGALFTMSLSFGAIVVRAALNDGLVAYYPLDNSTSDLSGNGNNGTVHGNATPTTDRFGNPNSAYYFDGTNSYIQVPDSPTLRPAASLSIACWELIYSVKNQDYARLVSKEKNTSYSGANYQLITGRLGGHGAASLQPLFTIYTSQVYDLPPPDAGQTLANGQ